MSKLYKLGPAAARIARLASDPEYSEDRLIDLARQSRIGICFQYRGTVEITFEYSPDGAEKEVGAIPFNGIVRLLDPPANNQEINGPMVAVSILRYDGGVYWGDLSYRLPVTPKHSGYINPGYKVHGFIKEGNFPREGWLIHIDDLNKIVADSVPTVKRWPWGDRTTKLLDLLAQAAQLWDGYDPKKPTTAPKSSEVEAWLREHGVSEKNAASMASLLRPDGLKPGPRK